MIERLEEARDGKHKYIAYFTDGKKTRFGQAGADDYTIAETTDAQRAAYRARHERDLRTGDPQRAGYLSMYLLWGDSKSITRNMLNYNRKFYPKH
jgi:hypothetical protein